MKTKTSGFSLFRIIQILVMAGLLAFIVLMLISGNAREVEMSVIAEKMEADPAVAQLTKKETDDAAETFSVDKNIIADGLYYRVDDVMDVNELFIVRIEDETNRQTVIDAVNKYLEEKTNAFDGYGTNQFGLLSGAITTEKGDYFFFGVSEDVQQWEAEFLQCVS